MLKYIVSILILILFQGCIKEIKLEETGNINGREFRDFLRVKGHKFDSLIIENCVFNGGGLNIGEVDHVTIRNCVFKDIKNNALKVGFIGPCKNIVIEGCSFENIGFNAIDSHESALDCVIRNCTIRKVALSDLGGAMAQAHHGIYWKGKNVLIEKNFIDSDGQNFGNSISIRSSGIIRKNIIKNSPKNGIMYFSNHPGGDSLLIENNFLINNQNSIITATVGDLSYHNKVVVIRFNSMTQLKGTSVRVDKDFEQTTKFSIYGNIMVNPSENFIQTPFNVELIDENLYATKDIGFIDINQDLHLRTNSEAHGYFSNLQATYPFDDIDGDIRNITTLNAGADE